MFVVTETEIELFIVLFMELGIGRRVIGRAVLRF